MAECMSLSRCIFFNDKMGSMPVASEMMKKKFCRANFTECARFMVSAKLGREQVPTDLYPNQVDRAKAMISKSTSGD